VAVDRGHGGAGQLGDLLEHELAEAQPVVHQILLVEFLEGLDVGAGDEAGSLAGAEHDGLGLLDCNALDQGAEFVQNLARQGVHALIGAIEGEYHDAVGAAFGLPVARAQAVEHGKSSWGEPARLGGDVVGLGL
jgi:hypothetical protein